MTKDKFISKNTPNMTNGKNLQLNFWLKNSNSLGNLALFEAGQDSEELNQSEFIDFNVKNYFVPGWSGESLLSKNAIKLNALQRILWRDAKSQFKSFHRRANSRKNIIYQDFLNYIKDNEIKFSDLFDQQYFWTSLQDPKSSYRAILDEFIDEFCFKAVGVYLFKIRFVLNINDLLEISLSEKSLLNPNYFLSNIFKRGGPKELQCKALETNQYSWFRPSIKLSSTIFENAENLVNTTISEFLKISQYNFFRNSLLKNTKSQKKPNSHALSHKSFGVFINNLLVFFPIWSENEKFKYPVERDSDLPLVHNVKFTGKTSCDLAESHWLAQENNLKIKWSEILCPDFYSEGSNYIGYFAIIHELNFLSFLISFSQKQISKDKTIESICSIMRQKYSKVSQNNIQELDFISSTQKQLVYDRIITGDTSKSTSLIFNDIEKEISLLSDNGYLYVLSNKNLMIPTYSEKIKTITKSIKLEAIFNFNKLKHKGEIPNYIYIFKKRELNFNDFTSFDAFGAPIPTLGRDKKEACYTFNLKGELVQFNQFSAFIRELIKFFENKSSSTTLYLKEFNHRLSLEYQMDAVLNGKLISLNQDTDQNIAHPQFLKGLSKNCIPFDQFFKIKSITSSNKNSRGIKENFLTSFKDQGEPHFQNVLIIDISHIDEPILKIISGNSLSEYIKENGFVYYKYFGLIPKEKNINIEIFHSFCKSTLGKQIIHLTFSGRSSNFSSLLKSFLVPEFFFKNENIPDHLLNHMSFLTVQIDDVISMDKQDEINYFNSFENILNTILKEFPLNLIKHLAYFNRNLSKALEIIEEKFSFSNPFIYEQISGKKLYGVYPSNNDIYIDFLAVSPDELNSPLCDVTLMENESSPYLQLIGENGPLLNIYSDILLLDFIKFVLNFTKQTPVNKVLTGLKIPSLENLQEIFNNHLLKKKNIQDLEQKSGSYINKLFHQELITK